MYRSRATKKPCFERPLRHMERACYLFNGLLEHLLFMCRRFIVVAAVFLRKRDYAFW